MKIRIIYSIILLSILLIFCNFITTDDNYFYVKNINSPNKILLDNNQVITFGNIETFDRTFSERNRVLAQKLDMNEEEGFIFGILGLYWANETLLGRKVAQHDNDLFYNRISYKAKFKNSPFAISDDNFVNKRAAYKLLKTIRQSEYEIIDITNDKHYPVSAKFIPEDFILIKKGYKKNSQNKVAKITISPNISTTLNSKNFKIILSDYTKQLSPTRNCNSEMCKELLHQINNSKKSIDLAIYGYSSIPAIEKALIDAQNRGVRIRMVYDSDNKGNNIYPDTNKLTSLIKNSVSDIRSKDASYIMHNKFYVFDNTILITGSANLSHTDLSGYNANVMIVINSPEICNTYLKEFEQMYKGKFHSEKTSLSKLDNVYFSPQHKTLSSAIIPIIKNAKNYIYIPTFIIIENNTINALIEAKKRGVDVKIIADALNASAKYSKIKELRQNNIPVKIENYAGKMHSKSMIVDDTYLIVGSMNFSYSGENRNDENTIIIKNADASIFYKQFFLNLWNIIPDKWLKYYPKAEGIDSIGSCNDNIDNDYDGLIDLEEASCNAK